MTSELIERVARAIADTTDFDGDRIASRYADSELRDIADCAITAVIEADREAVRAEVVGEIVDWLRVQQHGRTSDNYPGYFARQIEAKFGGRKV